jgi:hypothetical protein
MVVDHTFELHAFVASSFSILVCVLGGEAFNLNAQHDCFRPHHVDGASEDEKKCDNLRAQQHDS